MCDEVKKNIYIHMSWFRFNDYVSGVIIKYTSKFYFGFLWRFFLYSSFVWINFLRVYYFLIAYLYTHNLQRLCVQNKFQLSVIFFPFYAVLGMIITPIDMVLKVLLVSVFLFKQYSTVVYSLCINNYCIIPITIIGATSGMVGGNNPPPPKTIM